MFFITDLAASKISIKQTITGDVGNISTHLTCLFTIDMQFDLLYVAIVAKNKQGNFPTTNPIAIFTPGKPAKLFSSGEHLAERVTLTNITNESTNATLTFHTLLCEDENDYICTYNYIDDVIQTNTSNPTRMLVKGNSLFNFFDE